MDCGEGRGDTHLRRHRGERVVAEQPAACGHARTVEHNNIIIAKGQLGVGSEGESESSQEGARLVSTMVRQRRERALQASPAGRTSRQAGHEGRAGRTVVSYQTVTVYNNERARLILIMNVRDQTSGSNDCYNE